MRTTPEQRAVIREELRAYGPGDDLLDDLDDALAELAALRAVAEAGRAWLRAEDAQREPVRLFCEGIGSQADAAHAIDTTDESLLALRAALRAWEERER